jgi:hypothetical protein
VRRNVDALKRVESPLLVLASKITHVTMCLWIVIHMFMLPRTAEGYRTWIYLGFVLAPLAWAVAFFIW